MVAGGTTAPFFAALETGARQAARQMGVKLDYIPENLDATDLGTGMSAAVASHPNAIAFGDWYPTAENPIAERAVKSGIPVVLVNAASLNWQTSLPGVTAYFGQSDYESGVVAGDTFAADGAHVVLCVDQIPGATNLEQRCNGLQASLKSHHDSSIVLNIPQADEANPATSVQDIKAELLSNPKIQAVYALASPDAVWSVQAAQGAGRKVMIGTNDLSKGDLQDVQSGAIKFIINQAPYLEGYLPIVALANYLKYGIMPVGQVNTGPSLITKANVAKAIAINKTYKGVLGAV